MPISVRRLLWKLATIALSTAPATALAASTAAAADQARRPDLEDELETDVPIDREQLAPTDAAAALGRSLALALEKLRPLSATQLVSTWSLSDDPVRRLAIANALEWQFRLVGDAVAIDHLARDADPEIRAAAARAAWARRATGGDVGVIARLADDPDPIVRAVAHAARPR